MAVSADSVFSNAIVGQMMTGADVDIYQIDDLPKFPIGQGFTRADGAKFRYIAAGAATNRGVIVAQDYSESSENDADQIIVAPSSTYQMPDEPNGTYPGSINSRYVIITLASVTADQFAGGYLHTTDDVGEGYAYRIKGNTATDDPVSGNFRLALYDKIQVALTATTDHAITGNMYANVETAGTGTDGLACGVTCASLTATEPYGWVQTYGVATVLCDTAGAAGGMAILSQSVAGSYTPGYLTATSGANLAFPRIGYIITPGDTTGHGVIFLQLE
jgi:hypothetical protein